MDFLTEWITSIIIFILLATVMDMLLPSSSFQKYAKMVIGLLLIAVLISPIFKLLSTNFEDLIADANNMEIVEKGSMENDINLKKKEIQAAQSAYYLEEMAVQLKNEGEEELINQFNYEIKHIEVSMTNPDHLENPKELALVSVVLTEKEGSNPSIETVQRVEINTRESMPKPIDQSEDIKKVLATEWGINEEKIEIEFERRAFQR